MSGSKSSDPAAAHEPVGLTVHEVPLPDAGAQQRISGRLKMLMILLACAAPVVASYLTYYVIRPEGRSNYAQLILPSRALPSELPLREVTGQAVAADSLKGQWLLVVVGPSRCEVDCEQRLYMQRQLREMLGRERDRVDKVWLITDEGAPNPQLLAAVQSGGTAAARVLRVNSQALAAWLQPEPGHPLHEHLYVVDPLGEWMMRSPVNPQPERLKRDLDRLLRASGSWDKAGR